MLYGLTRTMQSAVGVYWLESDSRHMTRGQRQLMTLQLAAMETTTQETRIALTLRRIRMFASWLLVRGPVSFNSLGPYFFIVYSCRYVTEKCYLSRGLLLFLIYQLWLSWLLNLHIIQNLKILPDRNILLPLTDQKHFIRSLLIYISVNTTI